MPEIAEVARIVHYIRKHLVGKTLSKVIAVDDANVYGKVGTSGAELQKRLSGRRIVDAGQQGKYFWMIMDKPPHPLMHFGMTGWLKIKGEHTYYYPKSSKGKKGQNGGVEQEDEEEGKEGEEDEEEEWPPRFWKFHLETEGEQRVKAAFVDSRRFSRVRLIDCVGEKIRHVSPLMENGPDPVVDKDMVTLDWLIELCRRKKIPIKALLLDQANISGIGNWVGDEIMYHAKMHPEQYSNTLSDAQLEQLHSSIHHVCGTSVGLLGDSAQFPDDWLFKHRWGKGKKDAPKSLPNGKKITFLTVGGRTSAIVPSVQKKTGQVAKDISDPDLSDTEAQADDSQDVAASNARSKRSTAKSRKMSAKEKEEGSTATNGSTLKDKSSRRATAQPKKRQGRSDTKDNTAGDEDEEPTTIKQPENNPSKASTQKSKAPTSSSSKAGPTTNSSRDSSSKKRKSTTTTTTTTAAAAAADETSSTKKAKQTATSMSKTSKNSSSRDTAPENSSRRSSRRRSNKVTAD